MTLNQFPFETGPEGTALTNANSGSVASSIGSGSSTAFEAAKKAHGTYGGRFTNGAEATCYRRYPMAAADTVWQFSGVVTLPGSAVSGNVSIASFPRTDGNGRAQLYINAAGDLGIEDVAGANQTALVTGLTWGSKYRVTLQVVGGSTTTSQVTAKVYSGTTSWTTQVGSTFTASNRNFGTEQVIGVDLGICSSPAASYTVGWDDIQINNGSGTEIGDYVATNANPTVTTSANQNVAASATVNVTSTASDSDGTIVSRAWTYDYPTSGAPSLTGASTANASFTAGSAGDLYILRHTATDNAAGEGFATTEVRVPLAGNATSVPIPTAATKVGTWTRTGGTTDGGALGDASDATYLESSAVSGTAQSIRFRLQPTGGRSAGQVEIRLGMDTGTGNWTIRLYENTTLRQTWTQAATSSATDYNFPLSGPTISAITDWGNVWVEASVTS